MNDVKFLGGHGDMNRGPEKPWQRRTGPLTRENRIRQGIDPAWDTQYWSLWINGGGGVFADIWTASTFASNGIYVSNTSVQGKIYAMSVEHHVRNEVRFKAVSGWKVYALQLEEETRESQYCQPLEIEDSHNMLFANLYTFRVIRVNTPGSQAIRTWNCSDLEILNYHNYAQTLFPFTNALFDINSGKQLRPWEFARFYQGMIPEKPQGIELASGFEFAGGICADSKGNVYFCETRMKRIYSWSPLTNSISLLADFPWEPHSLSCDSKDNLLVVFRYYPQPGYMIDGEQEKFENPPDARGTSYSGWGNSGFATWVYSINPGNPEETIQKLGIAGMGTITGIYKALYPGNRWRDSHDFNEVILEKPELCFLAPDNKTIIPICYDLARCNSLAEGFPGKPVYMVNEYDKRVVKMEMDNQGFLSGLKYFAEKGEFCSSVDENGNVYIPDGNIYVFDPTGKQSGYYELPGRPVTLCVSGDFLFVTSADKLYRIRLK
jgi:sugar lactone lactonase YvrE